MKGLAIVTTMVATVVAGLLSLTLFFDPSTSNAATAGCGTSSVPSGPGPPEVPRNLYPIYVAANQAYGVPWQFLAAINKVETGFGTDLSTSSTGAVGWMQFEPGTWASYGVDANHDGAKDPYNPWDAIFAAARLLKANGAPQDMHKAIFSYNHADWYVREVADLATQFIRDAGNQPAPVSTPDTACSVGLPAAASPAKIMLFVRAAATQIGKDYVWGGDCTGSSGCDCSGLVWWAAQQAGFHFGRINAASEYNLGPHVDRAHLQFGDLLFWWNSKLGIHHVAIYLGPDRHGVPQMLAAPHTGTVVQVEPVYWDGFYGATRLSG